MGMEAKMNAVLNSDRCVTAASESPFKVNTRLIAKVQHSAGSHCHRAANLLNCYYLCAEAGRMQSTRGNGTAIDAALRMFRQAEIDLRRFLTEQLMSYSL
jgi:hypothetical protein